MDNQIVELSAVELEQVEGAAGAFLTGVVAVGCVIAVAYAWVKNRNA